MAWYGFSSFVRQSHLMTIHDIFLDVSQASFFDVPLHDNFWRASKAGSKYDLRKILNNSVVRLQPKAAVTFVDNHELVRRSPSLCFGEICPDSLMCQLFQARYLFSLFAIGFPVLNVRDLASKSDNPWRVG